MTDGDFKKIRAYQIRQQISAGRKIEKMSGKKRTNDELLLEEEVQEKIARYFFTFLDFFPKLLSHFNVYLFLML